MFLSVKYLFPFYLHWPNMPFLMGFLSDLLIRYRADRGLHQNEIAESLGLKPINISRWESGKEGIPWRHYNNLASVLGVPLDQFLTAAERENPKGVQSWRRFHGREGIAKQNTDPLLRSDIRHLMESVAHLDNDALATLQRCAEAFQIEDREVRDHLIGQLKLIERLIKTNDKSPVRDRVSKRELKAVPDLGGTSRK